MANKPFNSRIQLKHDTETNWAKATGFSPLAGELIIYDADSTHAYSRFKVGDGSTNVNALPFATAEAAQRAVDSIIGNSSTSNNLPTSAAVATFVEGKGYTTNIGTITGITMNGSSKGTSGVINLGTVLTEHQDISGKADKTATVSNVAYDSTNKKITKTINGTTSDVVSAATLKTDMSLDNVENKSSATIRSELTSSNVTTALGFTPLNAALKGANSGVAELDSNGKVPSSQLPSYVDDVLEYSTKASFPTTGETGKIYVDTSTNLTYRWSGTAYVEISASLALGTTSSTAFRGDYGNAAYTHAVTNKGSAFSSGLYKITTNSEGHVTAATAATSSDIVGVLGYTPISQVSINGNAGGSSTGSTVSFSNIVECRFFGTGTSPVDQLYSGTNIAKTSGQMFYVFLTGGTLGAESLKIKTHEEYSYEVIYNMLGQPVQTVFPAGTLLLITYINNKYYLLNPATTF